MRFDRFHRGFDIAHIIHRVKYAENINAVVRRALDELVNHVVSVMTVAENILSAQQHLHGRLGHRLFKLADAVPGIFTQIADTGIESRAAPSFQRPVTYVIQLRCNRQHIVQTHTRRKKRLMRIAQYNIGDAQGLFFIAHGAVPFTVVLLLFLRWLFDQYMKPRLELRLFSTASVPFFLTLVNSRDAVIYRDDGRDAYSRRPE